MTKAAKLLCITCTLFFFFATLGATSGFAQQVAANGVSATDELAYWNQIKGTSDPQVIKGYLAKFPNGMFYVLAKAKYLELGGNPADLPSGKAVGQPMVKKVAHSTVVMRHTKTKRLVIRHKMHVKPIKHLVHKIHVQHHKRKVLHTRQSAPAGQVTPFESHGGGGSSGGHGWGG